MANFLKTIIIFVIGAVAAGSAMEVCNSKFICNSHPMRLRGGGLCSCFGAPAEAPISTVQKSSPAPIPSTLAGALAVAWVGAVFYTLDFEKAKVVVMKKTAAKAKAEAEASALVYEKAQQAATAAAEKAAAAKTAADAAEQAAAQKAAAALAAADKKAKADAFAGGYG
jgi:hypothetical protein